MSSVNFWEQFATTFEQKNNYVVGRKNMNIFLERLFQEKELGHTLEIACGAGTYTNILIRNSTILHATDVSKQMLDLCKKRFACEEKIIFSQVDCFNLPFKDEEFDTIFMANILHIVPKAHKVIDECKRVLKKGGKIIILDVTKENMKLYHLATLIYRYFKVYKKKTNRGSYPFKKDDMTKHLQENGFEILSSDFLGDYVKAIYIVAKKRDEG